MKKWILSWDAWSRSVGTSRCTSPWRISERCSKNVESFLTARKFYSQRSHSHKGGPQRVTTNADTMLLCIKHNATALWTPQPSRMRSRMQQVFGLWLKPFDTDYTMLALRLSDLSFAFHWCKITSRHVYSGPEITYMDP